MDNVAHYILAHRAKQMLTIAEWLRVNYALIRGLQFR